MSSPALALALPIDPAARLIDELWTARAAQRARRDRAATVVIVEGSRLVGERSGRSLTVLAAEVLALGRRGRGATAYVAPGRATIERADATALAGLAFGRIVIARSAPGGGADELRRRLAELGVAALVRDELG
jgi:hypothetical protein